MSVCLCLGLWGCNISVATRKMVDAGCLRGRNVIVHPFFYKKQHTFCKGFLKEQNLLNDFKKAFLLLKSCFSTTDPPKS